MRGDKLRIAMLISGGGTTAQAIIRACKSGRLKNVEPVIVIASRPDAGGLAKAEAEGVRTLVVNRKACPNREVFGDKLLAACEGLDLDLVGQYGFAPTTPAEFVARYEGRVVNQHPGPLDTGFPDFGGDWMIGRAVHAARILFVVATGHDHWTEATTHFVTADEQLDKGAVIHSRQVPMLIKDGAVKDGVDELQARVLPVEHEVQIETLELFAAGGPIPCVVRSSRLVWPGEQKILQCVKSTAHSLYPKG